MGRYAFSCQSLLLRIVQISIFRSVIYEGGFVNYLPDYSECI